MRAIGRITNAMVKALNFTQQDQNTKDNSRITNQTEKESSPGSMVRYMMETGRWASKRASVSGKAQKVSRILVNGKTVDLRGMGFISGRMEIDTKVIGFRAKSAVKDLITSLMGTR